MKPLMETVRPSDVWRVVLSCLVEMVADEKSLTLDPPFDSNPETPRPLLLFAFFVSHQSDKETGFRRAPPPLMGVMDLEEKGVVRGIESELGFGTDLERVGGVETGSGTAPERVRGEERRAETGWSFDFVAITTSGENPERSKNKGIICEISKVMGN